MIIYIFCFFIMLFHRNILFKNNESLLVFVVLLHCCWDVIGWLKSTHVSDTTTMYYFYIKDNNYLVLMPSGIVKGISCCVMLILCLNHIGELQLFLFYSLSSFSTFSFMCLSLLTVLFLFLGASIVCVNILQAHSMKGCHKRHPSFTDLRPGVGTWVSPYYGGEPVGAGRKPT